MKVKQIIFSEFLFVNDCWICSVCLTCGPLFIFFMYIFSATLESDKCYYWKALNESMMVTFEWLILFCTLYIHIGISLTACYLGHSSTQKCLSRRPDHILILILKMTGCYFSTRRTFISCNFDRKRCRTLHSLSQRTWQQYTMSPYSLSISSGKGYYNCLWFSLCDLITQTAPRIWVIICLNHRASPIRFCWWIKQWYRGNSFWRINFWIRLWGRDTIQFLWPIIDGSLSVTTPTGLDIFKLCFWRLQSNTWMESDPLYRMEIYNFLKHLKFRCYVTWKYAHLRSWYDAH
jgi:hypothetical protein